MSDLALIGKKIGMSREFYKTGQSIPVTVLKMETGRIIQVIDKEKRGYQAVQVGFGKIKNSKLTKAMKGYFAKKNTEPKKILKEFKVKNIEDYKEGNEVGLEIFKDVKFVDVRSKTIGKGFAGAMKRHNFGGLRASHGVSVSHRAHGSTGQNQDPGKVFKGKKMAGHMGDKLRTMQNIEIIKTDAENNLIYLKGSIPGSRNTDVLIKKDLENNLIFLKGSVPGSKNSTVLIQKVAKQINRSTTLEKAQIASKASAKADEKVAPKKKEAPKKDVPKKEGKK